MTAFTSRCMSTLINKLPLRYNDFDAVKTESEFRSVFFAVLHVIKAKIGMADYCDLNRRYWKTSDIISR